MNFNAQNTPTDLINDFLNGGTSFEILGLTISINRLIFLAAGIILLFVFFQILKRIVYRYSKSRDLTPDIYITFKFTLRILYVVLIVWMSLKILGIQSDYIIIFTGLIATSITFASIKTINNFIAGLWLTITQPYIIGDYVKIGSTQGIVVKITTYYTRLKTRDERLVLIPNQTCLSSNILNFSINTKKFSAKIKELETGLKQIEKKKPTKFESQYEIKYNELTSELQEKKSILNQIEKYQQNLDIKGFSTSDLIYYQKDKIVRYVFTLDLPKKLSKVENGLKKLKEKWNKENSFSITYELINITTHFVYEFNFITLEPNDILQYYRKIISDIYMEIYS